MSIAENMIAAALSAAAGGGVVGMWFRKKMKLVIERKIDDVVIEIAELVKLELPQIDEIKKNVGIFIDSGVNKINKAVNEGSAVVVTSAKTGAKKKPMAFDKTAGVGRG